MFRCLQRKLTAVIHFYDTSNTSSEKKISVILIYVFLVTVSILQAKVSLKYATGGSLNIQFSNLLTLISILNFEWSNYFVQQKSNADLNWFGCPCLKSTMQCVGVRIVVFRRFVCYFNKWIWNNITLVISVWNGNKSLVNKHRYEVPYN